MGFCHRPVVAFRHPRSHRAQPSARAHDAEGSSGGSHRRPAVAQATRFSSMPLCDRTCSTRSIRSGQRDVLEGMDGKRGPRRSGRPPPRARAASRAISARRRAERLRARARPRAGSPLRPPRRPRAMARGFFMRFIEARSAASGRHEGLSVRWRAGWSRPAGARRPGRRGRARRSAGGIRFRRSR